jgi:hypothetical protein
MSTWHALLYPIKAGSEETVKELFRNSGRPQFDITGPDGQVVGRLLATMAFVGKEAAIRVIHVDGPLPLVAAHMSRQPEVKEFERQLEGARAFFQTAGMENVLIRQAPDAKAA